MPNDPDFIRFVCDQVLGDLLELTFKLSCQADPNRSVMYLYSMAMRRLQSAATNSASDLPTNGMPQSMTKRTWFTQPSSTGLSSSVPRTVTGTLATSIVRSDLNLPPSQLRHRSDCSTLFQGCRNRLRIPGTSAGNSRTNLMTAPSESPSQSTTRIFRAPRAFCFASISFESIKKAYTESALCE